MVVNYPFESRDQENNLKKEDESCLRGPNNHNDSLIQSSFDSWIGYQTGLFNFFRVDFDPFPKFLGPKNFVTFQLILLALGNLQIYSSESTHILIDLLCHLLETVPIIEFVTILQ